MSDHLNNQEVEELYRLFEDIKTDLSAPDFPTRTNRLEAVSNMKRVLEIHGYSVTEQKTAEELSEDKHQGREDTQTSFPDARDQHLIRQNPNKIVGKK